MTTNAMQQTTQRLSRAGAMVLVLAGGRGSRLRDLTDRRAKPAVHFGGKFRIIDFALSNCLNSGMRRIAVVTQYKSHSLLRHIQRGWSFLRNEMNEYVDLLPAQQRVDEDSWYRGHGRCGLPEPGHPSVTSTATRVHRRARGRSHLQDGLLHHAGGPRGQRQGGDGRLHRGEPRRSQGLRG